MTNYPCSPSFLKGTVWSGGMNVWSLVVAVILFRWSRANRSRKDGAAVGKDDRTNKIYFQLSKRSHTVRLYCAVWLKMSTLTCSLNVHMRTQLFWIKAYNNIFFTFLIFYWGQFYYTIFGLSWHFIHYSQFSYILNFKIIKPPLPGLARW